MKIRVPFIPGTRDFRAGFTLIELVVSAALMALVLGSAYMGLNASLSSRNAIEPRADIIQSARVALALIASDLKAACPLSKGPPFLGTDLALENVELDRIDFATHHFSPRASGEGDFCEMSYFLERTPNSQQYTLWRRRSPGLNFEPLIGGTRDEIATGLQGMGLEYYDGWDWYDTWGDPTGGARRESSQRIQPNLSGLPTAVRITLYFSEPSKPAQAEPAAETGPTPDSSPALVFQTVVRLELSESSQGGGSSGGAPGQSPSGGNAMPGRTM